MANLSKSRKLKYHFVYKTTNLINNKIYIGAHSTNTIDDNYLGSGKLLQHAIIKYGKTNFNREVLFYFSTPEEMFEKEKELVTEEFISSVTVYNIVTGGFGGLNKGALGLRHLTNVDTGEVIAVSMSKTTQLLSEGWIFKGVTPSNKGKIYVYKDNRRIAVLATELPEYIQNGWARGYPKSPTYGKIWIYSKTEDRYSLCDKDELSEYISNGWIKQKWAGSKKAVFGLTKTV